MKYKLRQLIKNLKMKKISLANLRRYIEKILNLLVQILAKKLERFITIKNKKAIYGTTTLKEREELAEEGIDLLSIPWVNKDN